MSFELDIFYDQLNDLFEAKEYKKVIKRVDREFPDLLLYPEFHYRKAIALYYEGYNEDAIMCFSKLINNLDIAISQKDPLSKEIIADLYYFRGLSYYRIKKYQKAERDLRRSKKLNPTIDGLDFAITEILLENKEIVIPVIKNQIDNITDISVEAGINATELNSNKELLLARAFLKRGDYMEAEEKLESALRIMHSNSEANYYMGRLHEKKGNVEDAIASYRLAAEQNPADRRAMNCLMLLDVRESYQGELPDYPKYEGLKEILVHHGLIREIAICEQLRGAFGKIQSMCQYPVDEAVVHYTKMPNLYSMISEENGVFRLYNVSHMNDPEEGSGFIQMLGEQLATRFHKMARQNSDSFDVYIGSFLPYSDDDGANYHNDLVMWRTYGRDAIGVEGGGCSVIIRPGFFKVPIRSLDEENSSKKEHCHTL